MKILDLTRKKKLWQVKKQVADERVNTNIQIKKLNKELEEEKRKNQDQIMIG